MGKVLEHLGATVRHENGSLEIDPAGLQDKEAPYELVRKMRASIYVLGPLLARFGRAKVSLPGGCAIGNRPIDLHLKGFEALGATIELDRGYVVAQAPAGGLRGADCVISGPSGSSVGATCNVLMAAVLAKGKTVLRGTAHEPEVDDLVNFLNAMGARVQGAGTGVLEIEGVESLRGIDYSVIPDRIEAGTLLMAAAMSGGDVRVNNCRPSHMKAQLEVMMEMGVEIEAGPDWLRARRHGPLRPVSLRTLPHPGFPTDMQAQFLAALCLAEGESTVTETIYPDRFMHVAELNRMGARVTLAHATAVVRGIPRFTGATVMASDLRASAALVLAGIAAEGETEILRIYHLDRGYEKMENKFKQLGADIERVSYERSPVS
jgi:UDP-N-acetylglucosamine 1-carboxyvinyltransferase